MFNIDGLKEQVSQLHPFRHRLFRFSSPPLRQLSLCGPAISRTLSSLISLIPSGFKGIVMPESDQLIPSVTTEFKKSISFLIATHNLSCINIIHNFATTISGGGVILDTQAQFPYKFRLRRKIHNEMEK